MNNYEYKSGYLSAKKIKRNKPSKHKRFQYMIDKINNLKDKSK